MGQWCKSQFKGRRKMSCPSSSSEKGVNSSSFCFLFCQALTRLVGAHPHWGGQFTLLSPPSRMLTSLQTPSQTHLETVFNPGTLWPVDT